MLVLKQKSALVNNSELPAFSASVGPACARYFEALAKDAELSKRREEIAAEMRQICERNPNGFSGVEQIAVASSSSVPADIPPSAVEKLLGSLAPAKVETFETRSRIDLRRAMTLGVEADALDTARRVLGDQCDVLRLKASAEYCAKIREKYAPIATDLAQALLALGYALERHDEFTLDLERRGVAWSYLLPIERPRWRDIWRQLKSAVEGGYLAASDLPALWRDR